MGNIELNVLIFCLNKNKFKTAVFLPRRKPKYVSAHFAQPAFNNQHNPHNLFQGREKCIMEQQGTRSHPCRPSPPQPSE